MSDTHAEQGGLTRREILKRGAILGGALMWTTPVVQTLGMNSALAQTVSDICQLTVALDVGSPTASEDEIRDINMSGINTGDHTLLDDPEFVLFLDWTKGDGSTTGSTTADFTTELAPGDSVSDSQEIQFDQTGTWKFELRGTASCLIGDEPYPVINSINVAKGEVVVS